MGTVFLLFSKSLALSYPSALKFFAGIGNFMRLKKILQTPKMKLKLLPTTVMLAVH
jgi:hypothetical protein